jgi:hypothetical protein
MLPPTMGKIWEESAAALAQAAAVSSAAVRLLA